MQRQCSRLTSSRNPVDQDEWEGLAAVIEVLFVRQQHVPWLVRG